MSNFNTVSKKLNVVQTETFEKIRVRVYIWSQWKQKDLKESWKPIIIYWIEFGSTTAATINFTAAELAPTWVDFHTQKLKANSPRPGNES